MVFRKSLLSSSVALALVGTYSPAFAQDDEAVIEEIIVEGGIRGSLKASMDIKRDSMGVVDAISAEDIGKFPDANLAESLQRITGVSISRSRGEGSQVTVLTNLRNDAQQERTPAALDPCRAFHALQDRLRVCQEV